MIPGPFDWLAQPVAGGSFFFLLGLIIGSFLNVCIHRVPRMFEDIVLLTRCLHLVQVVIPVGPPRVGLVLPRSYCPHCGRTLGFWDLIPVLSYLWLRGKCRYCRASFSAVYPLVEITCASLLLANLLLFGLTARFLAASLFTSALIPIFVVDLRFKIIPQLFVLPPLALLGLLSPFTLGFPQAFLAAAAAHFALYLVREASFLIWRREGMGEGDVNLAALFGAFFGFPNVWAALLLSFFIGGVASIGLLVTKRLQRKDDIPFGPYMVVGALLTLYFGDRMVAWYLSTIGLR